MNANDVGSFLQEQAAAQTDFRAQQEKIDALHHIIRAGNLEAVKSLVDQHGCTIVTGKGGPRNRMALQAAFDAGNFEIVQYLVLGPISNLPKTNGRNILCEALSRAVCMGQGVLQLLCEQIDAPLTEDEMCDAVKEACHYSRLECLAYLVETHAANVDRSCLCFAARRGQLKNIALYFFQSERHSITVNSCLGLDVFFVAARSVSWPGSSGRRCREVVEWLVSEGINVNGCMSDGCPPLVGAVVRGDLDTVRFLFSLGADVNLPCAAGSTPLEWACSRSHNGMVELLHSIGAVITSRALHNAAARGRLRIVEYICEEADGVDIHDRGSGGKSVLHLAVNALTPDFAPTKDLVLYLLQKGVNPNILDDYHDTPLHLAVRAADGRQDCHLKYAVVVALLQAGANPMLSNLHGQTPMSCALSRTDLPSAIHLTLVFLLLEHGIFSGVMDGILNSR